MLFGEKHLRPYHYDPIREGHFVNRALRCVAVRNEGPFALLFLAALRLLAWGGHGASHPQRASRACNAVGAATATLLRLACQHASRTLRVHYHFRVKSLSFKP